MPTVTTTFKAQEVAASGMNKRGAWALNVFKAEDGNDYQTFDQKTAAQANALIGQLIYIEYEEKQNGDFVNRVIEGVELAEVDAVAAPVVQTETVDEK